MIGVSKGGMMCCSCVSYSCELCALSYESSHSLSLIAHSILVIITFQEPCILVVLAKGVHPFPSRTRKLSPSASMVVWHAPCKSRPPPRQRAFFRLRGDAHTCSSLFFDGRSWRYRYDEASLLVLFFYQFAFKKILIP